jgi:hypothetical protein
VGEAITEVEGAGLEGAGQQLAAVGAELSRCDGEFDALLSATQIGGVAHERPPGSRSVAVMVAVADMPSGPVDRQEPR